MKRGIGLFLAIAVLAAIGGFAALRLAPQKAQPAADKTLKLEYMEYVSARKVILGYGWKPVSGPCMQVDDKTCAAFPEIGSCAAVDPGECGMVFVRQDRCLYLTTTGGQPDPSGPGDTQVEDVSFRSGPCSKT
ncbi:hypothetical protein [Asticcacaulis solisilvae]|uniref:hypothetical protein n=1 Tax=Asticcacaulis solisilvae TaxID=1217274 RepID=UPI003FD6EA3D